VGEEMRVQKTSSKIDGVQIPDKRSVIWNLVAEFVSGKCRVCGCTQDHPCVIPLVTNGFIGCSWIDPTQTLCDNVMCVAQIPLDTLLEMAGIA
jgi:hypothetical protein